MKRGIPITFATWGIIGLGAASSVGARDFEMHFSTEPVQVRPRGVVEVVQHPVSRIVLGSATRVCLNGADYERTVIPGFQVPTRWRLDWQGVDASREYWITPSHVTNALEAAYTASGQKLQLEMRDELMDLALFSTPKTEGPCLPLADNLDVGSVYDIEAGFLFVKQAELEIEAPEVQSWGLQSFRMRTLVSTYKGEGIPGRDLAGPLLAILARGFRGQSGGAILAQVDSDGAVNDPGYRITLGSYATPKLIGMIIAVDTEGRRMAALPAPTIYQRLRRHFIQPTALQPLRVRSVRGGTLYTRLNAIHYRGWLPASGTGGMADGGTGGMADGGVPAAAPGSTQVAPLPISGLQMGPRRWLSLGTRWAEYEALPQELLTWLEAGNTPDGIYEEEGVLKTSRLTTPLPEWFELDPAERDLYSMNSSGSTELRASYQDPPRCSLTLGMQRRGPSSFGTLIMLCSRASSEGQEFWLSLAGPRDDTPKMDFHLELKRKDCPTGQACDLQLQGTMFSGAPDDQLDRDHVFLDYWQRVQSLRAADGTPMSTQGLRFFQKDKTVLMLTRLGGYRILAEGPGGETFEISGPSGILPDSLIFRRELLNPNTH